MVASSHLTANENSFRRLSEVAPSAVTLKTTSQKYGGDGKGGGRRKVDLDGPGGVLTGAYTDGPKPLELWNLEATIQGTQDARRHLGADCAIGLSVLDKEDYVDLAKRLPLDEYQYVELNWKYALRDAEYADLPGKLDEARQDAERFAQAFSSKPLFLKLPREASPLIGTRQMSDLLGALDSRHIALIVANSRRAPVPLSRSRQSGKPDTLNQGVLVGDLLFLETYDLFRRLGTHRHIPALVATGGVMDIGSVIDLAAARAVAFQLASAIDAYGHQVLTLLRYQLETVLELLGAKSWTDASSALAGDEDIYRDLITSVRKMMRMPDDVGTALNASELDPVVMTTLGQELQGPVPETWTKKPDGHPPLDSVTFLVLPGNVSTSLLARRVAAELGLKELEMRSSSDFAGGVIDRSVNYGFAILQSEAIARLETELPENSSGRPVVLGEVARSCAELVGSAVAPKDLRVIYYFPGSSFRPLIEKCRRAAPGAEFVPLDRSKLLVPLLSAWNHEKGIIAKPPLSRIYGRLTPAPVAEHWNPLMTHCEPLRLIASKGLSDSEAGGEVIQLVCFHLYRERQNVLDSPQNAAHTLRSFGLAAYLNELLAYKGQNTRVSGLT